MSKSLKKLKIGVMPLEEFKKRTISIAKGAYKPKPDEPKIWFSSIKSLANVLSEENQELLRLIINEQPQSVSELVPLTGRKANNILRTLRTMENYGLVELAKAKGGRQGRSPVIPIVVYETAEIEIRFFSAH